MLFFDEKKGDHRERVNKSPYILGDLLNYNKARIACLMKMLLSGLYFIIIL